MSELVSVSEYARATGKDPGNIRRMLESGRIDGHKVGNQWVLSSDTVYPSDKRVKTGVFVDWRKKNNLSSRKLLSKTLEPMTKDLESIYGDILHSIVLYGSYARGEQTDESDVDIAVMLSEEPTKDMTDMMLDKVSKYEIMCGKVLSVIDIEYQKYISWNKVLPFYKNILKDGITLWKKV